MAFRVGVLISGEGSNLQAILDSMQGRDGIEVVCVGSSRAEARGLERAKGAGVETGIFAKADHPDREARDAALGNWLDDHHVDLVVLAGFMEVLSGPFIRRFDGRIVNVHPSLLPAFSGINAIAQALEYGVRVAGVTVHFVDEGVDSGPVILQAAVEVPDATGAGSVMERLRPLEHRLLPEAIRLFARGALRRDPANPRRVLVDG